MEDVRRELRWKKSEEGKARALRRRNAYCLHDQIDLGVDAGKPKEYLFMRVGTTYGWLKPFMEKRFDIGDMMIRASKAAYNQIKGAVRTAQGGTESIAT